MTTTQLSLDEQERSLFMLIKKEMCIENPREIAQQVTAVLHALRQTLSLSVACDLLNRLPDFLKMIFASNWRHDEARVTINHLDEFVNLVMERDRKLKKHLFKSEEHTLSIAILTLKKMHHLVDFGEIRDISASLRQELSEVDSEGVLA
ncbi:MAG TPA: DUF2267 domain-containing protein [Ohtaekwangia sp.]